MHTLYAHILYICTHTLYAHILYMCTHTLYAHILYMCTHTIYIHILYICTHTPYTHTHTHTEWSYWSTTSCVPGMVPKRVVDISPLPSWHLEQRGRMEKPAIQATVWREGHQTRLTGTDNKLYHTIIIVHIYIL